MTVPATIPVSIDTALLSKAKEAAAWREMSLEQYVASVIDRASQSDLALASSLKEATDSIGRGEYYTQEQVELWFNARHGQAAAE